MPMLKVRIEDSRTVPVEVLDEKPVDLTIAEQLAILRGNDGVAPIIGENGNWFNWDKEAGEWMDTGIRAEAHDVEVDDVFDAESVNPVQNKIITRKIDKMTDDLYSIEPLTNQELEDLLK